MRKLAFFGGRGDPLKKRILPHHAPLSFFFLLPSSYSGQQSLFSAWKESRNRVNVAFRYIVGGVYSLKDFQSSIDIHCRYFSILQGRDAFKGGVARQRRQ